MMQLDTEPTDLDYQSLTTVSGVGGAEDVAPPPAHASEPENSSVEPHPETGTPPPPDPLAELRRSPEYIKDRKFLDLLNRLENGQLFYEIDNDYGDALGGGLGDKLISRDNLKAAAADDRARPELRDLAKEILANPGLWALLDSDGNGVVSARALQDRLQDIKAKVEGLENAVLHPAGAPPPAASGASGGASAPTTPPASGAGSTSSTSGGTDALLSRPVSLDMGAVPPGGDPLTSATDRLQSAMGGLESQIDQVVAQMGQETDEKKLKALEARLNKLNRAMTEVSNMLQQLMTMVENLSKMFNDIAMNSIRHIS